MKIRLFITTLCVVALGYMAQANDVRYVRVHMTASGIAVDTFPNWFNLDMAQDNVMGVSTEKTYQTLLKGKKGEKVVVAVIDSGVDIEHEDLKEVIWTNPGEIPGNGKDDDGNGYVDDVHGWNFIGGADGKHVNEDSYELTRVYKKLTAKYKDMSADDVPKKDKEEYALYKRVKEEYETKAGEAKQNYAFYKGIYETYEKNLAVLQEALGKDEVTDEDISGLESDDEAVKGAVAFFGQWKQRGIGVDGFGRLEGAINYYGNGVNYGYNLDFNPRTIVGDNYSNSNERIYGNNLVEGPDARHGTHVAGIIAASRGNGIGMDGVADNVEIMVIRTVPNGDERDKDVANSIRYAVDNGATIINMSFGKAFSWDKKVVDDAVRYATKNDVLLVHAAGNDSKNTDQEDNFPNDTYETKKLFGKPTSNTWIEVGALSWEKDRVANFTNYAKEEVDLFAPGVDIYATVPGDEYEDLSGTSMAAPVVAGVAAVLRSYYPELSAAQIKEILMATTIKSDADFNKPGSRTERMKLNEMSVSGGIINLYEAAKMAEQTKGKRKNKHLKKARAAVGEPGA